MFDPELVFEEVLSNRLARLHAFALFLACDREDRAEDLLGRAVGQAFDAHMHGEDAGRALERGLFAEAVLASPRLETPQLTPTFAVTSDDRRRLALISPACLRRAAARIPAGARAAIWFVVVERRSYREAAILMGTDERTVGSLLGWRDALIRFALDDHTTHGLRAGDRGI